MLLGTSLHNARHDIAAALDHAKYDSLVILAKPVVAADECFVRLNRLSRTAQRRVTIDVAHIEPDHVTHAPSRLVGHAKLALHFLGGHAVPRLAKQEHDIEPIPQAGARLFERGASGRIDLIAAMLADEAAA